MSSSASAESTDAIRELARAALALEWPDRADFDVARDEVVCDLHAFARRLEGRRPLTVLLGPSGGGKSTIFNAIIGRRGSRESSIQRPSTRGAVLALPTDDGIERDEFGPLTLRRGDSVDDAGREGTVTVIESGPLGPARSLIDGPDHDTHLETNRRLADRLSRFADRVLFVVSPERYADAAALPLIAELGRLGTPIRFILNRVSPAERGALEADVRRRLQQSVGREVDLLIIEHDEASPLERRDAIDDLRRWIAQGPVCRDLEPLRRRCLAALDEQILEPLSNARQALQQAESELAKGLAARRALEPGRALARLARFEERARLLLRYAPRRVLRGLSEFVRRPLSILRSAENTSDSIAPEVSNEILAQGREAFDRLLITGREILKASADGRRALAEDGILHLELSGAEVDAAFTPLANELARWSDERLARFRVQPTSGALARLRRAAIDRLLHLLALCLTVTVVPPLLHELLRVAGLPALTSEVEARVKEARAEFERILADLERRQIERWLDSMRARLPAQDRESALRLARARLSSSRGVWVRS